MSLQLYTIQVLSKIQTFELFLTYLYTSCPFKHHMLLIFESITIS